MSFSCDEETVMLMDLETRELIEREQACPVVSYDNGDVACMDGLIKLLIVVYHWYTGKDTEPDPDDEEDRLTFNNKNGSYMPGGDDESTVNLTDSREFVCSVVDSSSEDDDDDENAMV